MKSVVVEVVIIQLKKGKYTYLSIFKIHAVFVIEVVIIQLWQPHYRTPTNYMNNNI